MADLPTESERHVLKDPASLKKAAKPLSDYSQQEDVFFLDDHECRRHAGEVRRRNDGNVRAEPPPPRPAQAKTTNRAKPNQGRKKQTNGLGDDDDSDSDRDRSQRGFGDRNEAVTVRKNTQPPLTSNVKVRPKHNMAGPSSLMPLTPQEEERVQLQRQITRQRETHGGVWEHFLRTRQDIRASNSLCKWRLIDDPAAREFLLEDPKATLVERRPTTHVFRFQQFQMSRYLDGALGHDIVDGDATEDDNYLSKVNPKLQLLEYIIGDAEAKFVLWWRQFVVQDESTVQDESIVQDEDERTAQDERTVQEVVKSLWTKSGWINKWKTQPQRRIGEGRGLDSFAANYEQLIFAKIGLSSIFELESPDREHFMEQWQKRDYAVQQYLDTMMILSKSRKENQRLNQEYIDWACSSTPPSMIERYCQQGRQEIRGAAIRKILESSSTRQEFCQDMDYEGSLSLVLFKGGVPFSIKPVSLLDQERMGWYRMQHMEVQNSKFYRYKIDDECGHTFKVGVNGELLALWTPRGEIPWKEEKTEHGEIPSIIQGRSAYPRTRVGASDGM